MLGLAEAENDLWGVQKEHSLANIVDEYRRNDRRVSEIAAVLQGSDVRSGLYSEAQTKQLADVIGPLREYLGKLSEIHAMCKKATLEKLGDCTLPTSRPSVPSFFPADPDAVR